MATTWSAGLAALLLLSWQVRGQGIDFELRTNPGSPVIFADSTSAALPGLPRRQLVTVKNDSKRSVSAVVFEQTVTSGLKVEIVALEHVSVLFAAGEKRRVSVAVDDVYQKLQSGPSGRPALSIVAVEFMDGSQWNAPTGSR